MASESPKLKVEYRPLAGLRPSPHNPRKVPEKAVEAVARSIGRFGFRVPLVAAPDGEIVCGHVRFHAALRLGLSEVPCVDAGGLTSEELRAFRVADNKTAELGEWDEAKLAEELEGLLRDIPPDLLGFDEAELDELLAGEDWDTPFLADDELIVEPPEIPATTKDGDLWELGEHRLACGDTRDAALVKRLLEGGVADLLWTDPPYNVDYDGGQKGKVANDRMTPAAFREFLHASLGALTARTKGAVYVCMASKELPAVQTVLEACGVSWMATIIWAKQRFTTTRRDYQAQFEPIFYGAKGGRTWKGGRETSDVWFIKNPSKSPLHPTQKPVALVRRSLELSSEAGATVLDGFAGAGSTLIASERLGRKARLVELKKFNCDRIVWRFMKTFPGREVLLNGEAIDVGEVFGDSLKKD